MVIFSKKKYFTLFIFLLCGQFSFVFAQKYGQEKIDSLQHEISKKTDDTTRVNLLNDIAWEYRILSDFDKGIALAEQSGKLAMKIGFDKGMAQSYNIIGAIYNRKGNYILSIEYHQKALVISEKLNDVPAQAIAYFNLAGSLDYIGQSSEALKTFQKALNIFEKNNHFAGIANSLQGIGNIYYSLKDFDKALHYYQQALKINEQHGFKGGILTNSINIGGVQNENKDYENALASYRKALTIATEIGDKHNMALVYGNIGLVYEQKGDFDSALDNFHQSRVIAEEIRSDDRISGIYMQIGNAYGRKKQPTIAKKWFEKALTASTKTNSFEDLREIYGGLAAVDSMLGDFKSAYSHRGLWNNYTDSMFNDETIRKMTEAELQYAFEKTQDSIRLVNENEIALRDANIKARQRQQWLYLIGLLGSVIIGSLLFYQNRLRKKKNVELDKANRTKDRFFSILNHDLRAPVSQLIQFVKMGQDMPEVLDAAAKAKYEQRTIDKAQHLLKTMEDLLLWSKGQMERFEPKIETLDLQELLEDNEAYFAGVANLQIKIENPHQLAVQSDINYLKTIIRNLSSNAIKAMSETPNPTIIWKVAKIKNQTVLSITDNGLGAESEEFKALYDDTEVVGIKTGLGLHLIRDLAKAIWITISVESKKEKGTTVYLFFRDTDR